MPPWRGCPFATSNCGFSGVFPTSSRPAQRWSRSGNRCLWVRRNGFGLREPRPPFVPGFARPVSGPFPLCRRMLSLTWISVALSLHPKISFLADKHRNAWRSPGEQRRLNISTGHTVPVPSTIAREHSLKTHCCRYRSRVGFSGKPLKVTRYCCSGRAAAALTPPIWPLVSAVWVNVAGSGFVSVGVSSATAALGLPG